MIIFGVIAAFIFGTLIGSFLNVVIWRLPRGEKLTGRSHCPSCGQTLTAINLVPVLSYLVQRGRCSYCKAPISSRYALIELITGFVFALIVAHVIGLSKIFDLTATIILLRFLFIAAVLIAVFVIDLEHFLILDMIVFPAAGVVLVLNIILDQLSHQLLWGWSGYTLPGLVAAMLISGFFYLLYWVSRHRWIGFGDVKLGLFLGVSLGLPLAIVGLFLSYMLGAMVGLILIAFGRKKLSSRIPFGTFLSISALISLLWGLSLWQWYLLLIGWH